MNEAPPHTENAIYRPLVLPVDVSVPRTAFTATVLRLPIRLIGMFVTIIQFLMKSTEQRSRLFRGHSRTPAIYLTGQFLCYVMAVLAVVTIFASPAGAADAPKACANVSGACTLEDTAVEYQQKTTGVHFFTACKEEKLALDQQPALFAKTDRTIPLWTTATTSDVAVAPTSLARYFISVSAAEAARHFQTVLAPEKGLLDSLTQASGSAYCFERAISGYAVIPTGLSTLTIEQLTVATVQANAACPAASRPVWRLFNDRDSAAVGKTIAMQHRFTASWAEQQQTIGLNSSNTASEAQAANWLDEGVRFCAPGPSQVMSLTIDTASLTPTAQQGTSAAYTLRFQLRNDAPTSGAALTPFVAVQLPVGMTYQSAPVGITCTADASNATGQRVVCAGNSLLVGGTANLNINATATPIPTSPVTIAAVAIGGASALSADQAAQLWPQACTAKARPAYGCDKATGQSSPSGTDTVQQAAAKLSFTGTLVANVSSPSASTASVALSGLALNAGSTTPVNVEFYVEYQTPGTGTWQAIGTENVIWSPGQQVTNLASPSSLSNIQATINYPATLPNPSVSLRICAKAMTAQTLWNGSGACTSKSANDGYTVVSDSKTVTVGTLNNAVSPVLTIQSVSAQTVQAGAALPAIDFQLYRQSNSSPPSGDFTCSVSTAALGYSCAASGTLLGASTAAYCHCTTSQIAPSSGTYTLVVAASAPGATPSGLASGTIQIYVPQVTTDYSVLTWSGEQITRNAQTGDITVSASVQNSGSNNLDAKFTLLAVGGSGVSATAVSPANGRTTIAAGASQPVSFTAAAGTASGTHVYLCVVRTNAFGDVLGSCTQPGSKTLDSSSSADLVVPPQTNPYWGVQLREQTGSTASPVDTAEINLAALTSGQSTASAWLVGCTQLQSGGGTPPACTVTFKLADNSVRTLPASPLSVGTDYAFYFSGADASGNLTVCAGTPWAATSGCIPVWQEALAVNSITVTVGTATKTVTVRRNIPPPASILTVTAPTVSPTNSGGTLPTLTYSVSRQNPSVPPTGPLSCAVTASAQIPNTLNYSCTASGDITTSTSASCACTPNPTTAPTVTATQNYPVEVTASATGATAGVATATVSVQTPAGNRGCTDDTSVPVIREIDFARDTSFNREVYAFSSIGDGMANPPSIAAFRLRVAPGTNWNVGVVQFRASAGNSVLEMVISRCRGRFDAGGREKVNFLLNYTGPENGNTASLFPTWWVDPVSTPDIFTAALRSPGKVASDGWVSDGIYYINMRHVSCGLTAGVVCYREATGSGSSTQL